MAPVIIDPNAPNPAPAVSATSPDGILTVYVIDDAALLVADFSTTNRITDPSFEKSTGGFVPRMAEDTVARDSARARTGTHSLKITPSDSNTQYEARIAFAAAAGRTYTLTAWQYVPEGTVRSRNMAMGQGVAAEIHYNTDTAQIGQWQQVTVSNTPASDGTMYAHLYGGDTAGQPVWYDDVSLSDGHATWPDGLERVRFTRLPDQTVRSGNDAWAVGGEAIGYDMEAPLGRTSAWIATPVYSDGTLGDPSDAAALSITAPPEPYDSWLKSMAQPELSMRFFGTTETLPEWSYTARQNLSQVQGSPYPAGGVDKHLAGEVTFSGYTDPDVDQHRMLRLLTSGTLQFQTNPDYDEPDFYCVVGDVTRGLASTMANGARKWQIPLTVIARPTPYGAGLYIPGRTLAETQQGSIAARQQAYPLVGDTLRIPAA